MFRRTLCFGIIVLAGCGESPSPHAATTWEDSAGVVLRRAGYAAPSDTIAGPADISLDLELGQLGPVAASPDGRVLVPDFMSPRQVTVFDDQGQRLGSVGREGEGPGEFRAPTLVTPLLGGGALILDGTGRRWTRFDIEGDLIEEGPLESGFPTAVSSDGQVIYRSSPTAGLTLEGRVTIPTSYQLWTDARSPVVAIGDPIDQHFHFATSRGFVVSLEMPWAPVSEVDVGHGRVVISDPLSSEVRIYSLAGDMEQVIRFPAGREAPSADEFEAWVEWYVSQAPEDFHAELRNRISSVPAPDRRRVIGKLILDDGGRLWVQRYVPDHISESIWDVFSLPAAEVRTVQFPSRFTPHDIEAGNIWGESINELGVQVVEAYRIPF